MSKYGFQCGIQRYKCANCNKVFNGGSRLNKDVIWQEYTQGKQTYAQLSIKYGCSIKTIQRKIDSVKTVQETTFSAIVNLLMETTYFGSKFGVMVFKDAITGQILLRNMCNKKPINYT